MTLIPGFGQISFGAIDAPGGGGVGYNEFGILDLGSLTPLRESQFWALYGGNWNTLIDGIPDASSGSAVLARDYSLQITGSVASTTVEAAGIYLLAQGNGDNAIMVNNDSADVYAFTGGGNDEAIRVRFADLGAGNDKGAILSSGILLGGGGDDTLSSYTADNGTADTVVLDGGSGNNNFAVTGEAGDIIYIRGGNGDDVVKLYGPATYVLDLGGGFNDVTSARSDGQNIIFVHRPTESWQDLGGTSLFFGGGSPEGSSPEVSVEFVGDVRYFSTGIKAGYGGTYASAHVGFSGHYFDVVAPGYLPVGTNYQDLTPGEVVNLTAFSPYIGTYGSGQIFDFM